MLRDRHFDCQAGRRRGRVVLAATLLGLGGCDGPQSALEPNGPVAAEIATLWWVLLAIATLVCVAVIALLVYALFRRREFTGERPPLRLAPNSAQEKEKRLRGEGGALTESDDEPLEVWLHTAESDQRSVRWIMIAGALVPAFILTGTYFYTLAVHREIELHDDPPDLTIEVIGWQWWWEVHYLDPAGGQLFETANEIHIPVGKRVRFRLKSADVIHSFWAPQLAGKLDMIPGRVTQYSFRADRPGVYRGQCAEYCEEQHAHMSFLVIAEPEPEFRAWVAQQARDEVEIADPLALRGREVFLNTACAACHAVRGTPAVANLGPDLTHVASRLTLAAVTIPNTKGHLGGWIANPQKIKPGVNMPAVPLESEEFIALLRYLESLR